MDKRIDSWIGIFLNGNGYLGFLESDRTERAVLLVFTSKEKIYEYLNGADYADKVRVQKLSWEQVVKLAIKEELDIRIDRPIGAILCERLNIGRMMADIEEYRILNILKRNKGIMLRRSLLKNSKFNSETLERALYNLEKNKQVNISAKGKTKIIRLIKD
jgi:hypothetical protein